MCGVVFSPEESLRIEVEATAARWAAATGCDIRVGEGGIPVRVSADLGLSSRGTRVHGWTHCSDLEVPCKRSQLIIEVTADHKPATLAHELGHALPNRMDHLEGDALMGPAGGAGLISAADLTYVCERLHCQAFVPEA